MEKIELSSFIKYITAILALSSINFFGFISLIPQKFWIFISINSFSKHTFHFILIISASVFFGRIIYIVLRNAIVFIISIMLNLVTLKTTGNDLDIQNIRESLSRLKNLMLEYEEETTSRARRLRVLLAMYKTRAKLKAIEINVYISRKMLESSKVSFKILEVNNVEYPIISIVFFYIYIPEFFLLFLGALLGYVISFKYVNKEKSIAGIFNISIDYIKGNIKILLIFASTISLLTGSLRNLQLNRFDSICIGNDHQHPLIFEDNMIITSDDSGDFSIIPKDGWNFRNCN